MDNGPLPLAAARRIRRRLGRRSTCWPRTSCHLTCGATTVVSPSSPTLGSCLLLASAAPSLVQPGSDSLAGRLATVVLSPFTIDEVVPEAISLETHWVRGG